MKLIKRILILENIEDIYGNIINYGFYEVVSDLLYDCNVDTDETEIAEYRESTRRIKAWRDSKRYIKIKDQFRTYEFDADMFNYFIKYEYNNYLAGELIRRNKTYDEFLNALERYNISLRCMHMCNGEVSDRLYDAYEKYECYFFISNNEADNDKKLIEYRKMCLNHCNSCKHRNGCQDQDDDEIQIAITENFYSFK